MEGPSGKGPSHRETLANNWIAGYTEMDREKAMEILERNSSKRLRGRRKFRWMSGRSSQRSPNFISSPRLRGRREYDLGT